MGNFEVYLAIPSESLLYDHKTCFIDSLGVRLGVFHVCSQGNISGPFLTHNRVKYVKIQVLSMLLLWLPA